MAPESLNVDFLKGCVFEREVEKHLVRPVCHSNFLHWCCILLRPMQGIRVHLPPGPQDIHHNGSDIYSNIAIRIKEELLWRLNIVHMLVATNFSDISLFPFFISWHAALVQTVFIFGESHSIDLISLFVLMHLLPPSPYGWESSHLLNTCNVSIIVVIYLVHGKGNEIMSAQRDEKVHNEC